MCVQNQANLEITVLIPRSRRPSAKLALIRTKQQKNHASLVQYSITAPLLDLLSQLFAQPDSIVMFQIFPAPLGTVLEATFVFKGLGIPLLQEDADLCYLTATQQT